MIEREGGGLMRGRLEVWRVVNREGSGRIKKLFDYFLTLFY